MSLTKIASLSIDNAGNNVATITVPAGVTTAHLGIIIIGTGTPTTVNPTITNWTRIAADPSGQANSAFYAFKRLGGQAAGDTITANFSTNSAARMTAIWYDSSGADVVIVGTPGTRGGTSSANTVIPGLTTTIANQDVVVLAAERTTATGTVVSSWSPAAPTQDHYSESTTTTAQNSVSHYIGRFVKSTAGATGNYTATYSGASGNGAGMMMAVGAPVATTPEPVTPAIASTVWQSEPSATAMSIGWIVDKGSSARAVFSLASDLSSPTYSSSSTVPSSKWITARLTGLTPDTRYYVGLEVDGTILTTGRGNYKTLTTGLRASKIITSSCNTTQSNHVVFDSLKAENPDFFVHQGDIHYANTNDETTWRAALGSTISGARFSGMLSTVTMSYDWDNHDTGGNGSDGDDPWSVFGPPALRQLTGSAQYVSSKALYKTWVHAGVRYIETDRWAERNNQDDANSASKYMLSQAQEDWLLNILRTATEPAIVWFSGFPHYSNLVSSGRWGSYPNQRVRIGSAIAALPVAQRNKIVCLGGDSHSICADDGTNAMWNLPSLNASPLNQTGGLASGTWNIANLDVDDTRGYYSRLTFTPSGNNLNMKWDAVQDDGAVLATWSKSFPTTLNQWSIWNGTSEVPLNYLGVYNGTQIVTATIQITS